MAIGVTNFPTSLDTVAELIEAANNSTTTLNGALDNSTTTITVVSTSSFPSSGTISIDSEIISYTGKSATQFTGCTRAFEGTSAASHSDAATVDGEITARHHNVLASALIVVETKLGSGSSTSTANTVLLGNGTGTSAWGAVTNAYIDASAAIALSKLATVTASRALVSDASGFVSASSVTATELGYLSGVTSAIQTQIGNKQGLDATLTALAAYNTNGLLTQTATDTFTGRTITGTADKIDVTNGDGVSGNPTLTISSTYAGQSTIVTLGTVTTGTWNGTAVGAQYGGTGINTSASTGYPSLSTGTWSIISATTLTAALDAMVGDSGSGGTKGLVPAPSAGDAAAGKFLKADGTWTAPSGSGDALTSQPLSQFAATTSAQLAGVISDETGSGALVFATSPTLTTPTLGVATATSINKVAITAPATSATLTLADGSTLATSGANSITLTSTGATNVTLPTSGTLVNSGVTSLSSLTTVGTITSGGLGTGAVIGGVTMTLGSDGTGDIYYRSAGGVLTRLAAGTDGHVLTLASGLPSWAAASGGGLTVGATAIASGTAGRILYEATGNVLGEASGLTYQPGASPTVTITAQNATYIGLRVISAATPTQPPFAVSADNGTTDHFIVTSTGAPSAPRGTNGQIFGDSITVGAVTQPFSFGYNNAVGASYTMALGANLTTSGAGVGNNLYIGWEIANGNTGNSIGIGRRLGTSGANMPSGSIVLGMNTSSGGIGGSLSAVFIAGTADYPMNNVYFGKGYRNATPTAYTINGTGGSGTNIAGANLNLAGGKGTGTGTGGDVNIQFARAGSTGSSLNSLSTIMAFSGTTTATTATQTNVNGATTIQGQITENITLNTGGTTTDSTIDLPANSIILSVTARVTTTITTATDWTVGDPTTADRFSDANATLTAGTTSVGINQWKADRTTAGQGPYQASTAKVRITTTGTPGAGAIRITIHYITLTAPTS